MGKGVGLWTEIERDECEPPSTSFPHGHNSANSQAAIHLGCRDVPRRDLQLPYGPNKVSPLSCSQTIKADRN